MNVIVNGVNPADPAECNRSYSRYTLTGQTASVEVLIVVFVYYLSYRKVTSNRIPEIVVLSTCLKGGWRWKESYTPRRVCYYFNYLRNSVRHYLTMMTDFLKLQKSFQISKQVKSCHQIAQVYEIFTFQSLSDRTCSCGSLMTMVMDSE